MNRELSFALDQFDKDAFLKILQARVDHLQSESESKTAFFSPEYYASGIKSAREAIENIDVILAQAA